VLVGNGTVASDNTITATGSATGIYVADSSASVTNNTVKIGNGTGILLYTPPVDAATVAGNALTGTGPFGIYVGDPPTPDTGGYKIYNNTTTGFATPLAINMSLHPGTVMTAPTMPVISGIGATSTQNGATIVWSTDVGSDSQADYGLSTAYGSVSPFNSTMVTSHSVTLTGLSPNTLYHFRAKSAANGNTAVSADQTFVTKASSVTTTAPTVSFNSPANNATVSGTVLVSANATASVALASVQFQIDGSNIGGPVAGAPYQVNLDTTALSNSSHTLTAIATDTAGNTGKASITIVVNNTVSPPPAGTSCSWTAAHPAVGSVMVYRNGGAMSAANYSVTWSGTTPTVTSTNFVSGDVLVFQYFQSASAGLRREEKRCP
jgi:Bacterial Ig domain/Periplasmic copper-binding protein (NosD)